MAAIGHEQTRAVLRLVWPLISSLVMSMMIIYKTLVRDLRRRSSILLQSACDRVATAAGTVTAYWLWSAMSVKQGK